MPRALPLTEIDKALLHASKVGSAESVKELIALGARPDARSSSGATPLMRAAEGGHLLVCQTLLPLCDPGLQDREGWTALMRAARAQSMNVLALLLFDAPGASPLSRNSGGINALMMSCIGDFYAGAHTLLPFGGTDATTRKGLDAFMLTALGNHQSCFHLLLPHADLRRRDDLGRDASDIARDKGHDHLPHLIAAELARREAQEIEHGVEASRLPHSDPLRI